jgi:hypothetical protein
LYIGINKLGYTEKEIGHMTFKKWRELYKCYKNIFDIELTLKLNKQRYSDIEKELTIDDVIP